MCIYNEQNGIIGIDERNKTKIILKEVIVFITSFGTMSCFRTESKK